MQVVPVHALFLRICHKICELFHRGYLCLLTLMANALSLTVNVNRFFKTATVYSANTPTSVNYHFTRKCNYKCGLCFHTAKTSFVFPMEEAKRGLRMLKESGKARVGVLRLESLRNLMAVLYKEHVFNVSDDLNVWDD